MSIQLTPAGYNQLEDELAEIIKTTLPQAKERLARARSMGDLSENSEYHAAKEELGWADGRRREVEAILKQATVVQQAESDDMVALGKSVKVMREGTQDTFHIVGEFEADPMEKKLSSTSPIGAALMGHKVGETVKVEVPAGILSFEILSIS
jgi:transcription elongation factor GreA